MKLDTGYTVYVAALRLHKQYYKLALELSGIELQANRVDNTVGLRIDTSNNMFRSSVTIAKAHQKHAIIVIVSVNTTHVRCASFRNTL